MWEYRSCSGSDLPLPRTPALMCWYPIRVKISFKSFPPNHLPMSRCPTINILSSTPSVQKISSDGDLIKLLLRHVSRSARALRPCRFVWLRRSTRSNWTCLEYLEGCFAHPSPRAPISSVGLVTYKSKYIKYLLVLVLQSWIRQFHLTRTGVFDAKRSVIISCTLESWEETTSKYTT